MLNPAGVALGQCVFRKTLFNVRFGLYSCIYTFYTHVLFCNIGAVLFLYYNFFSSNIFL